MTEEITMSISKLNPAFDGFLYATVFEERDEMPVKVISALARLDLDPWSEAADLAGMPADGATSRLCELLAGVFSSPSSQPECSTTAARLVALLPQPATMSPSGSGRVVGGCKGQAYSLLGSLWLVVLASMLTSVLMANADGDASGRASKPIVSASSAAAPSSPARPSPH
jgi:hypothetical protein